MESASYLLMKRVCDTAEDLEKASFVQKSLWERMQNLRHQTLMCNTKLSNWRGFVTRQAEWENVPVAQAQVLVVPDTPANRILSFVFLQEFLLFFQYMYSC